MRDKIRDKVKNALAAVAVCVVMIGAACLGGAVAYLVTVAALAVLAGAAFEIGGAA